MGAASDMDEVTVHQGVAVTGFTFYPYIDSFSSRVITESKVLTTPSKIACCLVAILRAETVRGFVIAGGASWFVDASSGHVCCGIVSIGTCGVSEARIPTERWCGRKVGGYSITCAVSPRGARLVECCQQFAGVELVVGNDGWCRLRSRIRV